MLRNILYILVGVIHIVGLFFKFMRWEGAGEILVVSLLGISITLIEFANRKRKSKIFIQNIIYPLLGVIFVFGVLFKVMHFPYANILLYISIPLISIAFAEFAFSIRKSILSIIPGLYSITLLLTLFKIMHFANSSSVLGFCFLCFTITVPALLVLTGNKLKHISTNLNKHLVVIASLSLITFLIEYYVILYQGGVQGGRPTSPMLYIFPIFMLAVTILVTKKALKIEDLKEKFQNEYRLLQCLNIVFMITLVFQVLVETN